VSCTVLFVYHKTKCITFLYSLPSHVLNNSLPDILSNIIRIRSDISKIISFSVSVNHYPYLWPYPTTIRPNPFFSFREPSVGRSVGNNPFHFHPYSGKNYSLLIMGVSNGDEDGDGVDGDGYGGNFLSRQGARTEISIPQNLSSMAAALRNLSWCDI
jgi:hypothetical protein